MAVKIKNLNGNSGNQEAPEVIDPRSQHSQEFSTKKNDLPYLLGVFLLPVWYFPDPVRFQRFPLPRVNDQTLVLTLGCL